jgi:rare lipoprotein A (peptidoglycan hydrolase)
VNGARRKPLGAAAMAVCALIVAAGAPRPATAADLDVLRARAQGIADEVTVLEHRLSDLRDREEALQGRIAEASADLGVLEVERHRADGFYRAAMTDYVSGAVDLYKNGSVGANLELLLSAKDISDLEFFAVASNSAARETSAALRRALAARARVETAQGDIDERKQRLIAARARVDVVSEDIQSALSERRVRLRELTAEVKRLEARARRAAAERPDGLAGLLGSGPSGEVPDGFVGTGVTFEGVASWYGPGFAGRPTASGEIFDPSLFTAASKELPLGTWLYVRHQGKGVAVKVNDRGPYIHGRILDLSQAAAFSIGITGVGWIKAEILIKK